MRKNLEPDVQMRSATTVGAKRVKVLSQPTSICIVLIVVVVANGVWHSPLRKQGLGAQTCVVVVLVNLDAAMVGCDKLEGQSSGGESKLARC